MGLEVGGGQEGGGGGGGKGRKMSQPEQIPLVLMRVHSIRM